jgi:hypothetical protein
MEYISNYIVYFLYVMYLAIRLNFIAKREGYETVMFWAILLMSASAKIIVDVLRAHSLPYFFMYLPGVAIIFAIWKFLKDIQSIKGSSETKKVHRKLYWFAAESIIVFAVSYTLTIKLGGTFF